MGDRWNRVVNIAILAVLAILLLNPAGVVGRWVTAAYRERQEQYRVERTWDELASAPSLLGSRPRDGRGVIVEFVDYDCPVCRTVAPAVSEAARTRGVSVIVRHVPSERTGVASAEAALAAICTEDYGLFPEAHDALISDRTWLSTRDWTGLAVSVGIGDAESFGDCMAKEATRNRLARDRALADYLRIPGTPTFVSAGKVHPGAPGLALALAAASRAAAAEDRVPVRSPGRPAFDSSEHPGLSEEMREIVAGFFLPDSGLALVERTEIHMVDLSSGRVRVVGREGEGPREFGHIGRPKPCPARNPRLGYSSPSRVGHRSRRSVSALAELRPGVVPELFRRASGGRSSGRPHRLPRRSQHGVQGIRRPNLGSRDLCCRG